MGKKEFYKKKRKVKRRKTKKRKVQKGGAFGAGMALGMFLRKLLDTAGSILKVNI